MDKTPRICVSAGHGLSSRVKGAVDPGADVLAPYGSESDVVLALSRRLDKDFAVLFNGVPGAFHMLRNSGVFYKADDEAYANACDTFIEFHTNAAKVSKKPDGKKVGTEVLYHDVRDRPFAVVMSAAVAKALRLPDRGAKQRTDLSVLAPKPRMAQILVELFFGSDADDVAAWEKHRLAAELAIVNVCLDRWGWRRVKSLPRKWTRVNRWKRAWYAARRYRR